MRTNLEIAAELIAADVRNLNNIEEYCGSPDFTEQDYLDRRELELMISKLQTIYHRREDRRRKEWNADC